MLKRIALLAIFFGQAASLSLPFFAKKSTPASMSAPRTATNHRPVLAVGETNFACEQDLFCSSTNPQGAIHFGTAMNRLVMQEVLQYLPAFLSTKDTVYQMPFGSPAFRQFVLDNFVSTHTMSANGDNSDAVFAAEEVVAANNLHALLSIAALTAREIAISGASVSAPSLQAIATHSDSRWRSVPLLSQSAGNGERLHVVCVEGALSDSDSDSETVSEGERVSVSDAVAHFRWLHEQTSLADADESVSKRATVFVLSSPEQLALFSFDSNNNDNDKTQHKPRIAFFFSASLSATARCGVALTHDEELRKVLRTDAFFSPLSSAVQTAAVRGETSTLSREESFDKLAEAIKTSIERAEGVDLSRLPNEQVLFGTGGSSILDALGRALFQRGDRVALDAPFYSGFVGDFARSGVSLSPIPFVADDEYPSNRISADVAERALKRRIPNTLRLRAQRAWEDGCRGFLVCNPHNPTGRVSSREEIEDLCAWVKVVNNNKAEGENDHFHVIFDELYSHSVYDPTVPFHSAISHALSSPYIHVVRGFAKDFGLCGFKTGYGFSSNERVQRLCKDWRHIMHPSKMNAALLLDLLVKSDYGQDIYKKNEKLMKDAIQRVCSALTRHNIPHVVPHAGVFVLIDLSSALRRNPDESEYSLWRRLYETKRVNIGPGKMFGCAEPGWYRLCPFTVAETIEEGIARLGAFLKEEYSWGS